MMRMAALRFLVLALIAVYTAAAVPAQSNNARIARSTEPFNINTLEDMFRHSLRMREGSPVLYLEDYIAAYRELSRVFGFFGYVFTFARDDIVSKLDAFGDLKRADAALGQHNYDTFEDMFAYEHTYTARHLDKPGFYRSRWLHRALSFIMALIHEVKRVDTNDDLTSRVRQAYENTLASGHNWFVRQAARVALYSFPSRDSFIRELNLENDASGIEAISSFEEALRLVYDHAQALYESYE